MKYAPAKFWHVKEMLYKPDLIIELRPDRKRIVIRTVSPEPAEIWIDVADVGPLTELLNLIIETEIEPNNVVDRSELTKETF